ncbi:hypothetical protein SAMN04488133_3404 [Halobellus limi]|uniref:Uncharacterized protein n=1 Tax=Halobellus limi TaxID=699433 RepID=A0A1H6CF99_9EURY|nr:hypothetical protein SAMN04488133_3404 [Halobellus limi]
MTKALLRKESEKDSDSLATSGKATADFGGIGFHEMGAELGVARFFY